jgi:predicted RNA-binding Zn ribbon-like protein
MTLETNLSGVNVQFAHDTELALVEAAALVNTLSSTEEYLPDLAAFADFLARHPYSGQILGTQQELESVRALRPELRSLWEAPDRDAASLIVNRILAESDARPYLTRHDEYDWHLHVTEPEAPLAQRIAAEAAMAFLDLIRMDQLGRLKICDATDCDDVLVDLSKNQSKRFCATGNCGNRMNVAAYRARRRQPQTS